MTIPAVRASGWGYRHAGRDTWAVRNLEMTVEPGERVLLAGPSGAGKSTVLSGLAGLLDAEHSGVEEGALQVHGEQPARARGRVGMMFQDPETQLVMARSGDDVAFGLENHAVPGDQIWQRVDECLALVGFPYDRDRPTGYLSGGEKQRLVLAGVQAMRPALLLLDEPTANLDPAGAALVRETVARAVSTTGATLIVVEHRVEEWQEFVDRVVVLEPGGGVTVDGDPAKVFDSEAESLAAQGVWVPGVASPTAPPSPRRPDKPVLVGEHLSYAYPGAPTAAVSDVSVSLQAHETLAISGPNGSGKSTLALLLAGLIEPTAGEVRPPGARMPLHRSRAHELVGVVGTVFQDPEHQFLTKSVRAELELGPRRAGLPPDMVQARVDELIRSLRLDHLEAANPFTLSGGEKRRLSVATALAAGPEVLVLDEPTFGQDRRTWIELLDLLVGLRDDGHGICVVSHDRPFVSALADRELTLHDGTVDEVTT